MEEKKITCVICPNSCCITVKHEGEKIMEVSGNNCKRGLEYASNEAIHPLRSISSTVRLENGKVLAVKTTKPVPKENVFDVMDEINKCVAPSTTQFGDIVIKNVYGLDSDIICIGL